MKRTMTAKHDVEQPKNNDGQSTRLKSIKCIAMTVAVLLVVVVLVPIIIVATQNGKSADQPLWQDISPEISHLSITHTIITGAQSEKVVVAGKDSTDRGVIELYEYNNGNTTWTLQSQLVTGQDVIVASMAVSLHGNRIAVCTESPLRFMVYENIHDNNEWKQYGDTMYAMDILADENATQSYDETTFTTTPAIMLSDDGRIFAISLPTEKAKGSVHVLIDVNSLGGTIGRVWKHYGTSIRSSQGTDSNFAKHIAMDGAGQKIVVSGDGTLSMYEWSNNNGNESTWELTAEYDESPVPESGSVALSKDGTTTAIGSYKSRDTVDGSGELYILNDVWPWFTYNDENPWFIENAQDGPDYNHQSAGTVQVSLSSKGDYVLVGRQQQSDGNGQLISYLQVYHFDVDNTEWISIGLPFGRVEHETTMIPQQVDIADDGTKVVAVILGKVYVYKSIA